MDEITRFLILSLDGGSFAYPITRLLEITMPRNIQKDSGLTRVFEGKFDFRGKSIPVLNLKKLLKLPGKPGSAMLVVKGIRGILGILVDAVTEIIDTDQKAAPIPNGVLDPALRYYDGILRHKGELVILLNQDGLLQ